MQGIWRLHPAPNRNKQAFSSSPRSQAVVLIATLHCAARSWQFSVTNWSHRAFSSSFWASMSWWQEMAPRYSVHSLFNCPRRWRSTDFLVEDDEEDDEDELEDAFFSRFAPGPGDSLEESLSLYSSAGSASGAGEGAAQEAPSVALARSCQNHV